PERLKDFFEFYKQNGITAIADALLESEEQLKSIYEMDMAGELKLYYDGIVRFFRFEDLSEKIEILRTYQKKYTTNRIKINTLKLFLDGTNESGNSASLHPHINDPTGENY